MLFPFLPFMVHDFFPHLSREELGECVQVCVCSNTSVAYSVKGRRAVHVHNSHRIMSLFIWLCIELSRSAVHVYNNHRIMRVSLYATQARRLGTLAAPSFSGTSSAVLAGAGLLMCLVERGSCYWAWCSLSSPNYCLVSVRTLPGLCRPGYSGVYSTGTWELPKHTSLRCVHQYTTLHTRSLRRMMCIMWCIRLHFWALL